MPNENWPVHNLASAVVESMRKWDRKPADFYPTPPEVTQALIDELEARGLIKKGQSVFEPACGTGELARVFLHNGYEVIASDLRHTGYGLGGYDFLNGSGDWLAEYGLIDVLATNPPFSLAEEFILKALEQAPVVAMLLKSNYWNTRRGHLLRDRVPPALEIKLTWRPAFLKKERGNNPLMDCCWYVWVRGEYPDLDGSWTTVARPKSFPNIGTPGLKCALYGLAEALEEAQAARGA